MKRRFAVALVTFVYGGAVMGEEFRTSWPLGTTLEGWLLTKTGNGTPRWTLESDASAPSKGLVLKQSGAAAYPVALKQGESLRDGVVEVTFKPIDGKEDRAGGIVWRAKDADNYYVVRANALEDNVVAYTTVNGRRSPLEIVGRSGGYGVKAPVPAGQWHTLRVAFKGTRFTVTFDGTHLFDVEDTTFSEAGMVGLWTKADSVAAFDKLTITPTP